MYIYIYLHIRVRVCVCVCVKRVYGVGKWKRSMEQTWVWNNDGILLNHYEYGSADDVTVSLANREGQSS